EIHDERLRRELIDEHGRLPRRVAVLLERLRIDRAETIALRARRDGRDVDTLLARLAVDRVRAERIARGSLRVLRRQRRRRAQAVGGFAERLLIAVREKLGVP